MDVVPSQTLYVTNLYGKLRKDETKQLLYGLFGQYGKILDVVCMGNARLKGQAWVVFADITSSTNALRGMQDFPFGDGRPMRVQFAKVKSDSVAKLDGTWKKDKSSRTSVAENHQGKGTKKGTDKAAFNTERNEIDVGKPNKILFVEHLPEATTANMLAVLFKQFPGYRDARTVPGKAGIAFIDFENDAQASVALSGLQGFRVTPESQMRISYAK